jgi:anti-anti-sigma factor
MPRGTINYSLAETYAVIKLSGKVTWEVSIELNTLFQCLLGEANIKITYIDCADTEYMDSTMLGVLVHFKRKSEHEHTEVILSAPSEVCSNLFNDVGLNRVFNIQDDRPKIESEFRELPLGKEVTTADIESLIKKAHEELMSLNEKNRAIFSPVVNIFNIKPKSRT